MDKKYLPTDDILAVTKLTDHLTLNTDEYANLHKHIINFLNQQKHTNFIILNFLIENENVDYLDYFIKNNSIRKSEIMEVLRPAMNTGNVDILKKICSVLDKDYLKSGDFKRELNRIATSSGYLFLNKHIDMINYLSDNKIFLIGPFHLDKIIKLTIDKDMDTEFIKYLIKINNKYDNACLLCSSYILDLGNLSIIDELIKNSYYDDDYDPDWVELFTISAKNDFIDIIKFLINEYYMHYIPNEYVLNACIENNLIQILELLLEKYVEQNIFIPDNVISDEINDINKLLIGYANENQYHLFNSEIVARLYNCKSAKNV